MKIVIWFLTVISFLATVFFLYGLKFVELEIGQWFYRIMSWFSIFGLIKCIMTLRSMKNGR